MSTESNDRGYRLIESGAGRKLESFAGTITDRPCAAAVWPQRSREAYRRADVRFERDASGRGRWQMRRQVPSSWSMEYGGITWGLRPNDFGHLGIFPEQESNWRWIAREVERIEAFLLERGGNLFQRPHWLMAVECGTGQRALGLMMAGVAEGAAA